MTQILKTWRASLHSAGDAVLPPVRHGIETPTQRQIGLLALQYCGFAGLVAFGSTALIRNELSEDVRVVNPWAMGGMCAAFAAFVFLSIGLQAVSLRKLEERIDALKMSFHRP